MSSETTITTTCNCDSAQKLESLTKKFNIWQEKAKTATEKQRQINRDLENQCQSLQQKNLLLSSSSAASSENSNSTNNNNNSSILFQTQLEEAERRQKISDATLFSRLEVVAAFLGHIPSSASNTTTTTSPTTTTTPTTSTPTTTAEKQRASRSERALLQANAVNVELSEKIGDLQESLRLVTNDREKSKERLEIKDNTIRALESQLVEATFALQQASSRAERAEEYEHHKTRYASSSSSQQQQSSPSTRNISSSSPNNNNSSSSSTSKNIKESTTTIINVEKLQGENRHLQDQLDTATNTIHDLRLQVDHLELLMQKSQNSKRSHAFGNSVMYNSNKSPEKNNVTSSNNNNNDNTLYQMSEAERDELFTEIDELRATNNDLRAKISSLEMRCANDATSTSTIAALRQQLATKTRQIVELQEALASITSSSSSSSSATGTAPGTTTDSHTNNNNNSNSNEANHLARVGGKEVVAPTTTHSGATATTTGAVIDPHMAHLKSTILQLLISERDDVKSHLIPVVAALLQLPACDVRTIYSIHPEWMI